MSVVLCNAGPLMALGKLNRLDLLVGLFGQVQIPRAVYHEVVTQGLIRGAPDALAVRLFWQRQQWSVLNENQSEIYIASRLEHVGFILVPV
jgi:predicted nucleic acid-binding protein